MILNICAISDTHNLHERLIIPDCDILIHAGDESNAGSELEIRKFAKWLAKQPAKHTIWTPGNHSLDFAASYPESARWVLDHSPRTHILLDREVVVEGVKIWGSPATPYFHNWAYNFDRGAELRAIWARIPDDTSIVVTHGPPNGILDLTSGGIPAGCEELAKRLAEVKPKVHIFGHIHEGYGMRQIGPTTYINASIKRFDGRTVNEPTRYVLYASCDSAFYVS